MHSVQLGNFVIRLNEEDGSLEIDPMLGSEEGVVVSTFDSGGIVVEKRECCLGEPFIMFSAYREQVAYRIPATMSDGREKDW